MSFCRVCNKELSKKEKVCPRCGASVVAPSSQDFAAAASSNPAMNMSSSRAPGGALADRFFNIEKFTPSSQNSSIPANPRVSIILTAAALFISIFIYGVVDFLVTQHAVDVKAAPFEMVVILSMLAVTMTILGVSGTYCALHPERLGRATGKKQQILFIQTYYIITATLTESVAVYGLVLVFMSQNKIYYFPFAAVAIVAMLFQITWLMAALKFHDSFTGPEDLKTNK